MQELLKRIEKKESSRLLLESVWSTDPALRFEIEGWEAWSSEELRQRRLEMRQEQCDHIKASTLVPEGEVKQAWRTATDLRHAQACGYILSKDDSQTEEAVAAMEKHDELCAETVPPRISRFSPSVRIDLLSKNNDLNGVRAFLENLFAQPADKRPKWAWMEESICFGSDISALAPASLSEFSQADAIEVSNSLVEALQGLSTRESSLALSTQEITTADDSFPPSIPLPDVSWQELLDRYAIAAYEAFLEYWEEHGQVGGWQDLLQPPATAEEIVEASGTLTGLPDDFKQMVAIHNG